MGHFVFLGYNDKLHQVHLIYIYNNVLLRDWKEHGRALMLVGRPQL